MSSTERQACDQLIEFILVKDHSGSRVDGTIERLQHPSSVSSRREWREKREGGFEEINELLRVVHS